MFILILVRLNSGSLIKQKDVDRSGKGALHRCCAGVTGNKALPTWLITMLLLLLLIWLTEKMFVKAFKVHASEKERARWAEKKKGEAEQQGAEDDGEHQQGMPG